jgi:MFS family permease
MTNSSYRWVIVAAGGLLGCIAIGAMFSLPVFLLPISRDTGWSVTGVSSAMTIGFLSMAFASIAWGSLSDRLGARLIALIGSAILAASRHASQPGRFPRICRHGHGAAHNVALGGMARFHL